MNERSLDSFLVGAGAAFFGIYTGSWLVFAGIVALGYALLPNRS